MASLENFISHLGTCPPGNFYKLARCTEIKFCINFDHINLPAELSNTYTLKRINSDDSLHFLLHWHCCYSSSLSSDLAHY